MTNRQRLSFLIVLTANAAFAAPENLALGKPYTFSSPADYAHCCDSRDNVQLTDGVWQKDPKADFWTRKETVGWNLGGPGARLVTVDLGKDEPLCGFSWNYAAGRAGVDWPDLVFVYVSDDGRTWRFAGDLFAKSAAENGAPAKDGYAVVRAFSHKMPCHGRYVGFLAHGSGYLFVDEVEVYRGDESARRTTGEEDVTTDPFDHYAGYRQHQTFYHDAVKIGRAAGALDEKGRTAAYDRLLLVNAAVARAKGYRAPFFWTCDRWASGEPTDLPTTKAEVSGPLVLEMMRGETRSVAVNLTNPRDEPFEATVGVEGFPVELPIEVREVRCTLVKSGVRVGGLIVPNIGERALRVSVPSGVTRQFWISCAKPVKAGSFTGRIVAGGAAKPFAITVAPVDFPARPRLHVGGWDYSEDGNRFYGAPGNLKGKMARMREMFTDSPWAGASVLPAGGKFNEEGGLINADKLDFRVWNDWIDLWGKQARQYCVFWNVSDGFHGEKMGSPRFARMVGEYARAWYDGIKGRLNGRRVLLLLVDEPADRRRDERIVAWGTVLKKAVPEFVIFEDPTWEDPTQATPGIWDVSDVVCPQTPMITQCRTTDFYRALRETRGKELFLYSCSGPVRTLDPITYHRAQAWLAWRLGAKATFFWAFGCGGGRGDSFHPFEQPSTEYSPFFVSPTDAFRAKQSEAVMESVEDYEYLAMLQDRISAKKSAGEDVAALEKLLREAPDRALSFYDKMTGPYRFSLDYLRYDWLEQRDHGAMDDIRVEVLHALCE